MTDLKMATIKSVSPAVRLVHVRRQRHTHSLTRLMCCSRTQNFYLVRHCTNDLTHFTHLAAVPSPGYFHSTGEIWMQGDTITRCIRMTGRKERILLSSVLQVASVQLTARCNQSSMLHVLHRPSFQSETSRLRTYHKNFTSAFGNLFAFRGLKTSQPSGCLMNHISVRGFRTDQTWPNFSKTVFVSRRGIKTDQSSGSFINPLLELQKFVHVPIFSEEEEVFRPSQAEVEAAVSIFQGPSGSAKHAARFVGSYKDGRELPHSDLPEVCFLGRSNVGKSSLISCILSAYPQVKVSVSKQPGHTRSLNVYKLGSHLMLVDMPGYGHNMPPDFQLSVENYLATGRRLCRTFLLVDGEIGLTSTDRTALDMLHEFGVPYVIVLTKIDKVGHHKLLRNLMTVMEVCRHSAGHTCFSQPFLVSSKHGDGVMLLQTFIAYITGCVYIRGL